jgi:hypothetical protein
MIYPVWDFAVSHRVVQCIVLDPIHIEITVEMNSKILGEVWVQCDALVLCCQYIPAEVLDGITSMKLHGIVGKPGTLVHCMGNI